MMPLPKGRMLQWFSIKVTKIQPNTFESTVISPDPINPQQLNDLIDRILKSITTGDQLKFRVSIKGPSDQVELLADSIEEMRDQFNSRFPDWMANSGKLSIDRSKTCITIITENIQEFIKRIYFKNVRVVRESF
jgi:hypothetical protein